jgi:N-acetyl-anhydromuramoyl-L-alanine amidase
MAAPIVVDTRTGLVPAARQVLSPHFDERPQAEVPSLLVIHNISLPPRDFGGPWIEQFFCGNLRADTHPYFAEIQSLRVSAHLLIRRDGALVQFVPLSQRAWHAGVSNFRGRSVCNDFSIGVELEGTDDLPYDERQYATLLSLVPALRTAYPAITPDRIVGHSDIAPDRKSDPGPVFDWPRLRNALVSVPAR